VRDLVRHAPKQEPFDAGESPAADDDEVCLLLVRYFDDDFGRVAFACVSVQLDPLVAHVVFRPLEDRYCDSVQVDVLPGRAARDAFSKHLRIGIRRYEVQSGALTACEVCRLPDGFLGRLGASVPPTIERGIRPAQSALDDHIGHRAESVGDGDGAPRSGKIGRHSDVSSRLSMAQVS
jgi:hypothetical protein